LLARSAPWTKGNEKSLTRSPRSSHAYRERFLIEKAGGDLTGFDIGTAPTSGRDDDVIGVIELLKDEDVLPPSPPSDEARVQED